jgi:hypothetical protein
MIHLMLDNGDNRFKCKLMVAKAVSKCVGQASKVFNPSIEGFVTETTTTLEVI